MLIAPVRWFWKFKMYVLVKYLSETELSTDYEYTFISP